MRQIDGAVLGDCVEASNQLQESVHEFQQAFDANDLARMQEIVVTRHRLGLLLQTHFKTHCQIPMSLGSGEASLDRKLTCIARKFFAEAQSMPLTVRLLGMVRGVCTDLGTECGLADVAGCTLGQALPEWMQKQLGDLISEGFAPPPPLTANTCFLKHFPCRASCTCCTTCAGMFTQT